MQTSLFKLTIHEIECLWYYIWPLAWKSNSHPCSCTHFKIGSIYTFLLSPSLFFELDIVLPILKLSISNLYQILPSTVALFPIVSIEYISGSIQMCISPKLSLHCLLYGQLKQKSVLLSEQFYIGSYLCYWLYFISY